MPSNATYRVSINAHPGSGELVPMFSGQERTDPNHRVGPKILDYYLVHYVVSGQGVFHCRGTDYPVSAGDFFFIFPDELIAYQSDELSPMFYRWIGFKGMEAAGLLHRLGISAAAPVVSHPRQRRMSALFYQMEKTLYGGTVADDMRAGGLLRTIFAQWMDQAHAEGQSSTAAESQMERQIGQAIRLFTLQYEQKISIDSLAHTLGYDRTHFSKMFKHYTGLSPQNYLLNVRMEAAKQLLQKPIAIEQVAAAVGFADPLYFSKQFKKWSGQTPSGYRREKRPTL
ncbi:AraC family transcriptional regulator [Paenibacillus beijingensis]|uniref:AraC family transcriptional regulator n=1 Tax=Paenibacillus beijingensis TaxID=1126833 RepID=UPI0006976049|nr:AraC family transcriptional regulator [Paenibacillus beijingensis]